MGRKEANSRKNATRCPKCGGDLTGTPAERDLLDLAEARRRDKAEARWFDLKVAVSSKFPGDAHAKLLMREIYERTASGNPYAPPTQAEAYVLAAGACCARSTLFLILKRAVKVGLVASFPRQRDGGGDAANAYAIDWTRLYAEVLRRPLPSYVREAEDCTTPLDFPAEETRSPMAGRSPAAGQRSPAAGQRSPAAGLRDDPSVSGEDGRPTHAGARGQTQTSDSDVVVRSQTEFSDAEWEEAIRRLDGDFRMSKMWRLETDDSFQETLLTAALISATALKDHHGMDWWRKSIRGTETWRESKKKTLDACCRNNLVEVSGCCGKEDRFVLWGRLFQDAIGAVRHFLVPIRDERDRASAQQAADAKRERREQEQLKAEVARKRAAYLAGQRG